MRAVLYEVQLYLIKLFNSSSPKVFFRACATSRQAHVRTGFASGRGQQETATALQQSSGANVHD